MKIKAPQPFATSSPFRHNQHQLAGGPHHRQPPLQCSWASARSELFSVPPLVAKHQLGEYLLFSAVVAVAATVHLSWDTWVLPQGRFSEKLGKLMKPAATYSFTKRCAVILAQSTLLAYNKATILFHKYTVLMVMITNFNVIISYKPVTFLLG